MAGAAIAKALSRAVALLACLIVAAPLRAAPKVEDCSIDIAASEGAGVTLHSEDGVIRHAVVTLYGHQGRLEMAVTPMTGGDAVLEFQEFQYSRHIIEEGPLDQTLFDTARAVVRAGAICPEESCFRGGAGIGRETAQAIYDDYLRTLPERGCDVLYEG